MRFIGLMIAACFALLAQPAAAQQQGTTPPAQTTLAPSHISAGRDTLQAMLIDSQILNDMSLEAFRLVVPQMAAQINSSPFYTTLTPDHRRALAAYLEGLPVIGQQETMAGSEALLDRFAPQMASHFTESELGDIAAFVRTTEGRTIFYRSVLEGVHSAANGTTPTEAPLSEAENAALYRFAMTPGGAAFNSRVDAFAPIMRDIGAASTGSPRIAARIRNDICALLEDQCPQQLRGT